MNNDLMNGMSDAARVAITAHMYSAAHPPQKNKDFVEAYCAAYNARPSSGTAVRVRRLGEGDVTE